MQRLSTYWIVFGVAMGCIPGASGQSTGLLGDPPNQATGSGASATGAYSLDRIESVNKLSGSLSFSISAARLPAGPGGFSTQVGLVYNSGIYDLKTEVPVNKPSVLQMSYVPSAHGGGWNYSYKYTLWSQTRVTVFNSVTCGAVTATQAANWYKTIFQTPDGTNHALRLVGALDQAGNTFNGTLSSDDGQSYAIYDFAGYHCCPKQG